MLSAGGVGRFRLAQYILEPVLSPDVKVGVNGRAVCAQLKLSHVQLQ